MTEGQETIQVAWYWIMLAIAFGASVVRYGVSTLLRSQRDESAKAKKGTSFVPSLTKIHRMEWIAVGCVALASGAVGAVAWPRAWWLATKIVLGVGVGFVGALAPPEWFDALKRRGSRTIANGSARVRALTRGPRNDDGTKRREPRDRDR